MPLAKIPLRKDESKNARFYKYEIASFIWIIIFAGYSLHLGKEALVKEAVKLLGVLGAIWISGYQLGKRSGVECFAFPCGIKRRSLSPKTRGQSSLRQELNRLDKRHRPDPE